jgi:hypothetical protein
MPAALDDGQLSVYIRLSATLCLPYSLAGEPMETAPAADPTLLRRAAAALGEPRLASLAEALDRLALTPEDARAIALLLQSSMDTWCLGELTPLGRQGVMLHERISDYLAATASQPASSEHGDGSRPLNTNGSLVQRATRR